MALLLDPLEQEILPHHLSGVAALLAAERTTLGKVNGERDTEFIKRIVCEYLNAHREYLKANAETHT